MACKYTYRVSTEDLSGTFVKQRVAYQKSFYTSPELQVHAPEAYPNAYSMCVVYVWLELRVEVCDVPCL